MSIKESLVAKVCVVSNLVEGVLCFNQLPQYSRTNEKWNIQVNMQHVHDFISQCVVSYCYHNCNFNAPSS